MNVHSVNNLHSTTFSLDQILQDIPETNTEELADTDETYQNYKKELNLELKTTDRVWLEFHAGLCRHFGKAAKSILYRIVKASVGHPENSIAAANAITILKTMKVSFSSLDLQGIQISGADLSSAILDGADLSGANLERVNLNNSSLNNVNMSNTNLRGIEIGIPRTFTHEYTVRFNLSSPDNKYLISEDKKNIYFWDVSKGTLVNQIPAPLSKPYKDCMQFSPDGQFLFIYDRVQHIDIWSLKNFTKISSLQVTDEDQAIIHFSFSLDEKYLVTYEPKSDYFKLWDIQKTSDNSIKMSLRSRFDIESKIYSIKFSKTYPMLYFLKAIENKDPDNTDSITLNILNIKQSSTELKEIDIDKQVSMLEVIQLFLSKDDDKLDKDLYDDNTIFSLNVSKTAANGEFLFITIANSMYFINISNNQLSTAIKILSGSDLILHTQFISETSELLYLHKNSLCLFSIKNNQFIGKFRPVDTILKAFSIARDGKNIYANHKNEILILPLDALKDNKGATNESYEIDSKASCFSSDMSSVILLSNNFYMQRCDIETGAIFESKFLEKLRVFFSRKGYMGYSAVFSVDTQYIRIKASGFTVTGLELSPFSGFTDQYIIDIQNEKIYLKDSKDKEILLPYKNSEIIWDKINNPHEAYDIKASCSCISLDKTLLFFYSSAVLNTSNHQLCLWSTTQKKALIVRSLPLAITKLQISSDNKYILATTENGGIYMWKIIENVFRLLWRSSHNLQTQGLILGDNNLEEDIEEDLITKMGAMKIADK